jgi:hypothetical protein
MIYLQGGGKSFTQPQTVFAGTLSPVSFHSLSEALVGPPIAAIASFALEIVLKAFAPCDSIFDSDSAMIRGLRARTKIPNIHTI